jgi:hypothetical protein
MATCRIARTIETSRSMARSATDASELATIMNSAPVLFISSALRIDARSAANRIVTERHELVTA